MSYKIRNILIAFIVAQILLLIVYLSSQQIMINNVIDDIKNSNSQHAVELLEKINKLDQFGSRGETMLCVACEYGDVTVIDKLLNMGANPNLRLEGTKSPLERYCSYGYASGEWPIRELIYAGVDLNDFQDRPAIMELADRTYMMTDEQKAIAEKGIITLYEAGAKLYYGNNTVLHYAAKSDMANLIEHFLLTYDGLTLINSLDDNGRTPYQVAVSIGAAESQRTIRRIGEKYEEYLSKVSEEETEDKEYEFNYFEWIGEMADSTDY